MNTCIIIDDEKRNVETLKTIIENFLTQELKLLGYAYDVPTGYDMIVEHKPEILFLDIEMPHQNGFDLLEKFDQIDFEVIFTTGFDQYALTAIKFNALDYLLKPINIKELQDAVKKAKKRIDSNQSSLKIKNMLNNMSNTDRSDNKIPLPMLNGFEMVKVGDIVYCKADQDYTHIYLANGKSTLVSKSIKYYEELLTEYNFYRLHHSYIVNKNHIREIQKGENMLVMTNLEEPIPVSRRKKTGFIKWATES
ncbi:LytR/AlgR family response regulator transcription factor [Jiulongibacter sp. NS-SX5]|uniref:LytR/AlgR family response regulator transcription factor n=1 Tax=Jiulongibacter sp. NS-SX5 TaxID=3463854 RepID=UPI00405853A1